jgi:enediyne biosynthesis protein E4
MALRGGTRVRSWILAAVALLAAACSRESSSAPRAGEPWFEDAAAAAGVDFVHDSGHRTRHFLPESVAGGCAIFDYDGDGWMDLYFTQAGPMEPDGKPRKGNRLFRNRRDGTFEDATAKAGVGFEGVGLGCACGDYDGDGDTDLFVANVGRDVLYRNEGNGTFSDVTDRAGVAGPGFGSSAAFVDYDQDGDLDLFVAQYVNWSVGTEINCSNPNGEPDYCKPANYQSPALSVVYRNEGGGAFKDVSREAGIASDAGNGLGVACADLNGDGAMDFYVANDGDQNHLWINDGKGRFTEQGLVSGAAVNGEGVCEAGMGVAAVDLSNTGTFDLFVTNLVGETNTLYRNAGGASFGDETAAAGLAVPSRPFTGFGVGFRDFDHDGRLDLYVANGRVTRSPPTAENRDSDRYAEPDQVYRGLDGAKFEEVFPRGGTAAPILKAGRGAAFGDLDNDGDVDVVVANRDAGADVLRNVAPKAGNWIMLRVVNPKGADAIGALVRAAAGGVTRSAYVMPSYSYCSSSDPRLHFGLGAAAEVSAVTVRWPGGKTESFGPFAAGKLHEVRQGTGK